MGQGIAGMQSMLYSSSLSSPLFLRCGSVVLRSRRRLTSHCASACSLLPFLALLSPLSSPRSPQLALSCSHRPANRPRFLPPPRARLSTRCSLLSQTLTLCTRAKLTSMTVTCSRIHSRSSTTSVRFFFAPDSLLLSSSAASARGYMSMVFAWGQHCSSGGAWLSFLLRVQQQPRAPR